jgi:hypothetical protein
VVFWGFVHAAAVPLCQAIVLGAAPEAPECSNSLFNSFGNAGSPAEQSSEWPTIMGFRLENLVLNNRQQLHRLLRLNAEEVVNGLVRGLKDRLTNLR